MVKKILFYCWEYPPNGTGVGRFFFEKTRALARVGCSSVVVTGRAPGLPEVEVDGLVRIHRVYARSEIRSDQVNRRVLRIAAEENVDWIEGADHLGEAAALCAYPERPPVVISIHNCNPIRVVRDAEALYPWQRPLIQLALLRRYGQFRAEKRSFRRADALVVTSGALKQQIVDQGLAAESSLQVIPSPVIPVAAGCETATEPTLLFVGRLSMGKGIAFLPAMFEHVLRTCPDARLEIAGGDSYARGLGSLRTWLEKRLRPDIRSRVHLHGVLGPQALDEAYRRAWVLICPSRWDNFPNTVLDAMIRGLPVVASRNGGMEEMIADCGGGLAEPDSEAFAEHILAFLTSESLRREVGNALRAKALRDYQPERVARAYLEQMNALLPQPGEGGAEK